MTKKATKIIAKPESTKWITIKGAREHNLKNINVAIPKQKLTVITGPSGSGKSSLALDILFTEGKRRYMESLSTYARQFLGIAKKPDFDTIDGLCPSIAIEQKTVSSNPRSTVGTITEIYDYLRVLFARIGQIHCPKCLMTIQPAAPEQITRMVMNSFADTTVIVAAPLAYEKKGEFVHELLDLFEKGYYRFKIDGQLYRFKQTQEIKDLQLKKTYKHTIDVLIDSFSITKQEAPRLQEAIEKAFALVGGRCIILVGDKRYIYSSSRMCLNCGDSFPDLEPRLFSFNSPIGACKECEGLGIVQGPLWHHENEATLEPLSDDYWYVQRARLCEGCHGQRLNQYARAVTIMGKNIYEWSQMSVRHALEFYKKLSLPEVEQEIAKPIIKELIKRLTFLSDVGLAYLTIDRSARTLSGGEGQRIRLATQIGSALSGVLYILDEPSIGLHQRDNDRLITTLKQLRDLDNTVVVVEHDTDTIMQSDYVIDMGPAAGIYGGQVTAVGTPEEIAHNPQSLTGQYLSGALSIETPAHYRKPIGFITLHNAHTNNLKNLTVTFPLGVFCGVSGVSGSGKSTLIFEELVPALYQRVTLHKHAQDIQEHKLSGDVRLLRNLVLIDQSPIGRTSRSNPATYLGIFDDIRALYASLPESNARGYTVGRFSFNVPQGRCHECSGEGIITVSMHFLPDVTMICKACKGQRYNPETLQIKYRDKSIADVLAMSAIEAKDFFAAHKTIAKRLELMCEVGLDYIALGQPSTTLSGGEAQRIKLVNELAKRGSETIYILDEPTTGLHAHDIQKLLLVLNRLIEKGNSVIVIEHNLDVLKTTDYIIDMGPEGGDEGGTIVAQGTPRQIAASAHSYTGKYLKKIL